MFGKGNYYVEVKKMSLFQLQVQSSKCPSNNFLFVATAATLGGIRIYRIIFRMTITKGPSQQSLVQIGKVVKVSEQKINVASYAVQLFKWGGWGQYQCHVSPKNAPILSTHWSTHTTILARLGKGYKLYNNVAKLKQVPCY